MLVEVYRYNKLLFRATGIHKAVWWLGLKYGNGTYTIVEYTFDSGIVDETVGSTTKFEVTIGGDQ